MKISTKGLYAVRFMLNLAEHGGDKLVSLKEVSEAESVSKKYLEQIVPNLVSAQLVKSVRGAAGGYRLARPASDITVLDVLAVTEGTLAPVSCLACEDDFDCSQPNICIEIDVWRGLDKLIIFPESPCRISSIRLLPLLLTAIRFNEIVTQKVD